MKAVLQQHILLLIALPLLALRLLLIIAAGFAKPALAVNTLLTEPVNLLADLLTMCRQLLLVRQVGTGVALLPVIRMAVIAFL